MTASIQARLYFVSGSVQGVGYRFFAQRAAANAGVAGYVRNLRDGRVEVYAIGEAQQLAALAAELRRGPAAAGVAEVDQQEAEILPRYQRGFVIEHQW